MYVEAVNFDAGLVIANKNLGLTAGGLSQFDLALDNSDKVIEMVAEEAVNYRHRGPTYYYLNLVDEALTDFNEAISIDENYADTYCWYGIVNLGLSPKLSIGNFTKAIELDPDNEESYLDRACAHSMMKNFKFAKIKLFQQSEQNEACRRKSVRFRSWRASLISFLTRWSSGNRVLILPILLLTTE